MSRQPTAHRRQLVLLCTVGCWLSAVSFAHAEPITLRMATAAPAGTAWARIGTAFERDIATLTRGQVRMKWYLGGIAGDELQVLERIRRDQLDGTASAVLCQRLSPTLRALRIVGLFQNRDESSYVAGRMRDTLDKEFLQNGFINLGEFGVGPDVIFSRGPVTTMAELKRTRMWIWDLDDVYKLTLAQMGLTVVPRPLEAAARDFEQRRLDGFLAVPTAALAFQWSTEARYFADLRASFLRGCMVLSSRAYDQLTLDGQQAVRQAAARAIAQLEEVGREQDDALLGGLFARQGLQKVTVSEGFRAEFFAAAQSARDRLGDRIVPPALLQRVLGLLADYRALHRPVESER